MYISNYIETKLIVVSFPALLPAAILFLPGRWVWHLSAESLDVRWVKVVQDLVTNM